MGHYCENSILECCSTNREVLEKIYTQAISHRQRTELVYLPETDAGKSPFKAHRPLTELYPDYNEGDYVYFSSFINGAFDRKVLIRILPGYGDTDVWFNGEKQDLIDWMGGFYGVLVDCKKGENSFLAKVKAKKNDFDAEFLPIVPEVCVATNFYVYSCWHYMNEDGFRGQRGFKLSKLYRKDDVAPETENIEWIYPVKPLERTEKKFDFDELCQKGNAAYVYTQVKGNLIIKHNSPMKVFEGGEEVYFADEGVFEKTYANSTAILIKSIRKDEWGFTAIPSGETRLDFVTGADCTDLQWLWVGPFGRENDAVEEPYAPEFNLQFKDVYSSVHGPKYWDFYREKTSLIQTMQSNFFGQWFYALMVGVYGMKLAAAKLGKNKEFIPYYTEWMKMLCKHRDFGKFGADNGIDFAYLGLSCNLDRLDPIGTIGINISEYSMMTGDSDAKYLLKLLADSLTYNVPRFSDGTFNRVETMWTDDTYMSLPFMARLGAISGEEKYFDDILTQVRGFFKRMWMEEQGLFSHIYFVNEETPNRVPWGRGNGWVLLALSEVLLLLPENYHGREEILEVYRKFANPGVNNENIDHALGTPNETVKLVKIVRENANDIFIVNFGTHPDSVGGEYISADYMGYVCDIIEKAVPDTNCMFLLAPQGDVNHVNVHPTKGESKISTIDFDSVPRSNELSEHMGRVIAGAVLSICSITEKVNADKISFLSGEVMLPSHKENDRIEEMRKIYELYESGRANELPYKEMALTTAVAEATRILNLENGPDAFKFLVSAIRIGDLVFAGIGGEPFTEVGNRICAESPFDTTILCCLTNSAGGYIPAKTAYEEGGYEAKSSALKPGSDDILVESTVGLLKKL